MATDGLVALYSTTLTATATSVSIAGLPQGYRDLRIVVSGTTTSNTVDGLNFQLNNDIGANYTHVYATGDGSSASAASATIAYATVGVIGTSQSVTVAELLDYKNTDKHTIILGRGNTPGWGTRMNAVRWANTAAVTSVLIYTEANLSFSTGTTVSVFGIVG